MDAAAVCTSCGGADCATARGASIRHIAKLAAKQSTATTRAEVSRRKCPPNFLFLYSPTDATPLQIGPPVTSGHAKTGRSGVAAREQENLPHAQSISSFPVLAVLCRPTRFRALFASNTYRKWQLGLSPEDGEVLALKDVRQQK
jgi:hypothetical protein